MNNNAIMLNPFGKITITPYIIKTLKINNQIFHAFKIIPKLQQHTKEYLRTNQLTFLTTHQ
ncbi:hypothetical protein, partial [Klebsiella pneumoniae]|uniref:hypothetical protein n=1 Tax=Klebsiella pneumoniae TaxID=573 RepID=UPI00194FDCC6